MSKTWVKLCANTNLEDAQLAAELGADAVGFVFAPSKRQVMAEQVAAITPHLPAGVETIGVFIEHDAAPIIAVVKATNLTGVQLHGDTNIKLIAALNEAFEGRVKLLQVVGFESGQEAEFERKLQLAVSQPQVWGVLLDTVKSGASGGLGVAFDWPAANAIVQRVFSAVENPPKLIIAGGLKPENVAEAIRVFSPFGVDVASGVESVPGKKDAAKMRAFLAAAR
ncbi:phosphoribosylanthranilate isomerase [Granulicella cerasi]|uniref:N-(5'-phosphoribosyl)anthranilate isomerase n=1 Tax=Granulicella cerasi TaxID=741063 RepID=A0ABW1Z896_9BACT|nr:phosphoribosylanthranilate isomerase [Granulicella cerasi]